MKSRGAFRVQADGLIEFGERLVQLAATGPGRPQVAMQCGRSLILSKTKSSNRKKYAECCQSTHGIISWGQSSAISFRIGFDLNGLCAQIGKGRTIQET